MADSKRESCERRRWDVELTEQIKEIHADSGGIYGSPRVHAVLQREGVRVGRKRVERLVCEADIAGIGLRRSGFKRRDPKATPTPDLVEREITGAAPNRLWVTDLTVVTTSEGPLWLPDAFSRRVVARETSARADADLVLTTLQCALASREVEPGALVHHADHGCQYTVSEADNSVGAGGSSRVYGLGRGLVRQRPRGESVDADQDGVHPAGASSPPGPRRISRCSSTSTASITPGNSRRVQKRLGYLSPVEVEEKHCADRTMTKRTNLKSRQPALAS
ncbi:IS3 family transposase [Streptomyces sp. MBT62]|uniref:IS3 family transposase n=1 Tax=Streptomyces sp. MBT62 TaxID=2800410 RepID=UPI00190D00BE|nr:IS3 family transposase [Streptomyces sp. MBT62]MBK3562955.1 IS3 family transposase [Streptomyces sp. MBT62]